MKSKVISDNDLIKKDVKILLDEANTIITNTVAKVNYELINMYWKLGKMIVQYKKEVNSKYGDSTVEKFKKEIYVIHGAKFNRSNLYRAIQFYKLFSNFHVRGNLNEHVNERKVALGRQLQNWNSNLILNEQKVFSETQFKNINWSHIKSLLVFKDIKIISYYLNEVEMKNLTKDELIYIIKSKAFERTISNQREGKIKHSIEKSLKDPINLKIENKKRSEKELEDEIIKNIFNFMNEIGNSIMLYGRQFKLNNKGLIYKVDIVLYDKENKHFILIDLKINKTTQKDISQMKFYTDYFNKHIKEESDKNTVGLILVETKDERVETNKDIYQIKYLNEIPKDKELLKIINQNKIILLKTEKLKLEK